MFWATIILFLIASIIQCGLILLQQRGERLTLWWGRYAFSVYNVITLFPWIAFVLAFLTLQLQPRPELLLSGVWLQAFGALLLLSGTFLAVWVAVQLGPARLNGLRFFDPVIRHDRIPSGPFRLLKNPMYSGFFLIFLGLALWQNSLYNLAIALESAVLLNGMQAWIEEPRVA